jgi:peptidoglycan/LPS O-acetylase OafA/YrhL
MTLSTETPKLRIDALTGLRFFAALAVYLHHHPKPVFLPEFVSTFMMSGYNGVTLFFVLSGFVIGLNYFDMLVKPTRASIFKYALARFARIYPLYALVLLFIWFNMGIPGDTADIVFHFLTVQAWSSDLGWAFAYNSPGWSIGVEFFFYACFPLLVLVLAPLRRRPKLLWSLVFIVLIVLLVLTVYFQLSGRGDLVWEKPGSAHRWLYRTPLTRLGDFSLGILAALIFQSMWNAQTYSKRFWRFVPYVSALSIIGLMVWKTNLNSAFSWDIAYAPFAFLLILGIALSPQTILSRFLAMRPLIVLGEASFALYLIHYQLMHTFDIARYQSFEPLVAVGAWIGFAGVCILLSAALNVYVETPMRQFLNRFGSALIKPQTR